MYCSGGMPNNINVVHTLPKIHLEGYNYVAEKMRSIFIRLFIVASQMQNSEKIRTYSSSKSSILMPIESTYATSC